jgi:methylaspartate mutase epsilon subunit
MKTDSAVRNKRWSDDEFLERHKEILTLWPTGKDVDLDEAIEYHKRLPEDRVLYKRLAGADRTLLRLSCGQATVAQTVAHVQACEQAGADVLNWEPDSYTRKSRLEEAQQGLEESLRLGKPMLNGFPLINHGVAKCRQVAESINLPLMFNGNNDEEPMLLAETGFASGCTANAVYDLRDLITHSKNYPLEKRIINNQYVCKLAAYYTERGAPIVMWPGGCLLNYCPPSMGIAIEVIESLTAVEQGVEYLGCMNELRGNLVQDVAAMWVLRDLVREYLARSGYHNIPVWMSAYTWLGAWPSNPNAAGAFLAWLTATSVLAGADLVQSKSIQEAVGVTSAEASVKSAEIVKQIIHITGNQTLPVSDELKEEQRFIELEARAILDKVLELGDGDPLSGEVKAVETGVLDAPFSSWVHIKGKILPVRDRKGAFRYLDHGNLPFSREIIDYHRRKIAEREKAENRQAGYHMLVEDIAWLSKPLKGPLVSP